MSLIEKYAVIGSLAVLLLAGCSTREGGLPLHRDIDAGMEKRGAALSAVVGDFPIRGVLLPENGMKYYVDRAPFLIQQMESLGLNRLYVEVASLGFFSDGNLAQLEEICRAASERGVVCEAVLFQRNYVQRRYGSVWSRKFGVENPLLEAVRKLRKYNEGQDAAAQLAGVTIAPEIHFFTLASPELPSNALYLWSENAYGPGRDNDLLMRRTLDQLRECRAELGVMPMSVAVPAFYHDRAAKGDLTCGLISDFLALADRVIVLGEGAKPSEFGASFDAELKFAGNARQRVVMGLNLSAHTVGAKNALRRRDWADFVKITRYLASRGAKYDAFGGMVFMPWASLELLWEE